MSLAKTLSSFIFMFLAACALPGNAELDPRDELALSERMSKCDDRSMRIRLDVRNNNPSDVHITLVKGSGGFRSLRPKAPGLRKSIYNLSRSDFRQGNFFLLAFRSGVSPGADNSALVELQPVICARGTLEIGSTLNLSFFIGAKWD